MITIEQQIAEVRREIGMRERVYPRFVSAGRITHEQATERIARLRGVLQTLEQLRDERAAQQGNLFGAPPANAPKPGQNFDDIPF